MQFVNPKNDVAFKKIFGSEDKTEVLIGFLNAVLDLQGDEAIQTIRPRNPYQSLKLALEKQTILDIYATDNRGFTFIVEMQMANVTSIIKRFAYYVAREYSTQIERGQDYPSLRPVIFVGVLDFTLFKQPNIDQAHAIQEDNLEGETKQKKHAYLSGHKILDEETYKQEIGDFSWYFIELPKFTKKENELDHILDKWVYFIKHAEDLDVIPTHVQEYELQTAYELANRFGWAREELELYEHRGIKIQDELGALELAEEVGLEKGLKQGLEQGKLEVAQNLLNLGLSIDQIRQATDLSAESMRQLGAESE